MTSTQRSILAVALLTQGVSIGLTYGIFPVFLIPLEEAFAAPRTWISAGQIVIMLALSTGSLVAGAVLDKGYARRVMLFGALLLSGSLLLAGAAPNLFVLGLAAAGMGFSVPSVGPLAGASLLTRSFDAGRGRAIGLMSMGPPLGSGLFAALAGWLLIRFEVRETFSIFSLLCFVVLVPAVWWIVPSRLQGGGETRDHTAARRAPSAAGVASASRDQTRAGSSATDRAAPSHPSHPAPPAPPAPQATLSIWAVLRRPTFWWTAGVFALAAGIATAWTVHVAAYLAEAGLEEAERAGLLAAQFWMGVPGALIFGALSDRFSLETLFVTMLGGMGLVFLSFAMSPPIPVILGLGVTFGFLTGGMVPLYMMLIGRRMGPTALGRAMGMSNLVMLPVMALSVLLAAHFFETQARYDFALQIFSAGMLLAIVCVFGSKRSGRAA